MLKRTLAFVLSAVMGAVLPSAAAEDLLQIYRDAVANDPTLAGITPVLSGVINRTVHDINGNNTVINNTGNVASTVMAALTRNGSHPSMPVSASISGPIPNPADSAAA